MAAIGSETGPQRRMGSQCAGSKLGIALMFT